MPDFTADQSPLVKGEGRRIVGFDDDVIYLEDSRKRYELPRYPESGVKRPNLDMSFKFAQAAGLQEGKPPGWSKNWKGYYEEPAI